MLHDFRASLERSNTYVDAPWWREVYEAAFPDFACMVSVRDDGWAQRGGIDRVVTLRSGRTVTVDEKVRDRDWPDIALERWSDRRKKVPGWIQKGLACDYIAYAFVPSQRCLLFPFLDLRRAWLRFGRDWISKAEADKDGYRIVLADNGLYQTESIAVPTGALVLAIAECLSVTWGHA